ncbi:MAG: hypothetical protein AAF600_09020 [Bacteroidota bacterium]
MKSQWKTLTLVQPNQFRLNPPPTDWSSNMEELKQFNAEHQTSEIARKWKSEPVWDRLIERKILEYNLDPLETAFVNAVFYTDTSMLSLPPGMGNIIGESDLFSTILLSNLF